MTISPTKMNVFYAGIENPVSISVPGIPSNKIRPKIKNGRLVQRGSGYVVYPDKPGRKTVITVLAELEGGTEITIGSMDFRVKSVPDPVATVAGKNEGIISKNLLLAEQGVFAEIPDFDFEMNFKVSSFDVVFTTRDGFTVEKRSPNNRFTEEQLVLMKNLNSGNRLIIENIVAKGDDGSTRNLSAISFKIR
jgi:gliding motility-associated protein GldM